jgi:hypothetical protein
MVPNASSYVPDILLPDQRPALLEVKNSGNSSTPNLIYLLFGTGVKENINPQDYSGWVVAYTYTANGTSASLTPQFKYSNEQTGCGSGGGLVSNPNPPPQYINGGQIRTETEAYR